MTKIARVTTPYTLVLIELDARLHFVSIINAPYDRTKTSRLISVKYYSRVRTLIFNLKNYERKLSKEVQVQFKQDY